MALEPVSRSANGRVSATRPSAQPGQSGGAGQRRAEVW